MWILSAIANAIGSTFIGKPNYLFDLLFNRVQADGGVTEAEQCTISELTDLQNDNLLSSASLIVTPNAYKEGKLYSVIPSDGSGDLSVTRATTATRVNSAGLVELVPYNLLSYSVLTGGGLNVTPTGWSQQNTTGNFEPFGNEGGSISYRFWATAGRRYLVNSNTLVSGSSYAFSFYVDSVDTTTNLGSIYLPVQSGSTITNIQYYVDDVLVSSSTNITANTRIKVTFDCTSAGVVLHRFGGGVSNNATYDFVMSRPQFVEGTEAKDYYPTQTRLNIPRIDYSNGTCPSILLEPQRTNLALYSQQFDNAPWTTGGAAVTPNFATSPSGLTDAELINGNIYQAANLTIGATYTLSVWAKLYSLNAPFYLFGNSFSSYQQYTLSFSEYQRVSFTFTATQSSNVFGFSGYDVLIWGAQLEAGAYATSYIPTTSASVTRNGDVLSKTGISSLLNSTQGVLYFEAKALVNNTGTSVISISNGTNQNTLYLGYSGTANSLVAQLIVGGAAQCNFNHTLSSATDTHKVAVMYASNNAKFYVNGVQIDVDTTINVPSPGTFDRLLNNLGQGSFPFYSNLSSILYFNTTLTDDQLEALTGEGFDTYQLMAENYNYILQ